MPPGLLAFEGGAYPALNLKAWNGRLMTSFFDIVLKAVLNNGVPDRFQREVKLASAACNSMLAFLHCMETSPRYLSAEQATKMYQAVTTFLALYQLLAAHSLATGIPRWKATPKFHLLLHVVEEQCQTLRNSRAWHCFLDEDYIGQIKRLVIQCPKDMLEFRCLTRTLLRLHAMR